uniref:Uncharacterized protein n=1 Tax=Caenorhabditis japonica TaxID=281687 RepID=A0A8R1E640_CAEJA
MTFLKGLQKDIRQDVRKSAPASLAEAIRIASTNEAILTMEKEEENHQLVNAVTLLTESVRKLNNRDDNDRQFSRYEERRRNSIDQSRDRDQKSAHWKKKSYQPNRDQGKQDRRRPNNQRRNYRQSNEDEENPEHRQRNQSRDNYSRGRSQRKNRGNNFSTNFLFATIVVAAAMIQGSTASDYFDCTKTTGGILIMPPMPTNCTTEKPTTDIVIREIQIWLWKPDDQIVEGHRCTREVYRRCTESLFYVSSFNQSLSRIEAVTAVECRTMINERRSGNRPLNRIDSVTFATSLEEEDWPERTVLSTTCEEVYRNVLQKGPISEFEDKILSPLLLNTNSCLYEDEVCGNEAAIVLWKVPAQQKCKQILVATHSAQVTESTILIPSSQSAFRLSIEEAPTPIQNCFNQRVYLTTSSVMITFNDETPKTRRKRSNVAYDVLERFLEQRIHLPQLTLRQFDRARNRLPQLIQSYNITEYEIEKHLRLHPSKDISLAIIHAIVNAELLEARKRKFHYPTITFADTPVDYSTTEAESWISLAKIMFREIKDPFVTELNSNPISTVKPQPAKSYMGSSGHANYLKTEYDKREEYRRNISSISQNAKSQYQTEVIQEDQRRNFAKISKIICQTNNRQLQVWEALLKIDSTIGMRALLQRQDIMAHFVGSRTLLVAQCTKVEANEVIRSRRIGEVCYAQTPILTSNNMTLFILPGKQRCHQNSQTNSLR